MADCVLANISPKYIYILPDIKSVIRDCGTFFGLRNVCHGNNENYCEHLNQFGVTAT